MVEGQTQTDDAAVTPASDVSRREPQLLDERRGVRSG
jgi:hypothetical protein